MIRLSLIWLAGAFVGCTTPTALSDNNESKLSDVKPEVIPDIPYIRLDPNLSLPFKQQLEWQKRLHKMSPEELWKLRRGLEDGMFKSVSELERLGMLYPLPPDPREI